jgi:serine/threonine-protein kinase
MSPQESIGHYRLVSKLGEGGMGAVYRATDTRLNRDVAIKILPPAFAEDAARMQRFEREAQVLASLNHPNIAAIYGIEQGAIVMELVEGQDLDGPLPVDTAIAYARQIAAGLEAAHEKGVVHRDLKPANIKVTPDGTVKLLDFGLAKAAEPAASSSSAASPTLSPTLSLAMTQAGMILGTAAYMSPEQARGKAVDRRADIWAFGVILYELLTGTMLFGGGETVSDSLAAVLTRAPDFNLLPVETPTRVRRLLELCLRKDVRLRLQAIGDARILLDEPDAPVTAMPAVSGASRFSWLPWALFAASVLAGGFGWWRTSRPAPLRPLLRLSAEIGLDMPVARALSGGVLALSPDGTQLAITLRGSDGRLRLYTRALGQAVATPLVGAEDAGAPFFSTDGKWIGFEQAGKLKKIPVDGGAPIILCDAPVMRGASWGDDDNIVFGMRASGLWRVPAGGGTAQALTKVNVDQPNHRWPQVLTGSRTVLLSSSQANGFENANIEALNTDTGQRTLLVRGGHSGRYVATADGSGRLLYVHDGALYSVAFDRKTLRVTGNAVPLLDGVSSSLAGGADFAVSQTGTLVFLQGPPQNRGVRIEWLYSSGSRQPLHPLGAYQTPRFSRDGKRLAFAVVNANGVDIWVKEIERDTASRLTFLKANNSYPTWTPDGKAIVFRSWGHENPGLYWIRSDGGGEPQRLTDGSRSEFPGAISPDGKRLLLAQNGSAGDPDLYTAAIEGDAAHPRLGKPEAFLTTSFVEWGGRFSPDGRWIAYVSNESGVFEIYVRPFPGPGGRWQISAGGGETPVFSASGRELLFRTLDGHIMAAPYTTRGDSFDAGKPYQWTQQRSVIGSSQGWPTFDLAPDGKRLAAFLRDTPDDQRPVTHVTFLANFGDELLRRAREGEKDK